MKNSLRLLALALTLTGLTAGCKKSSHDPAIDLREKFVGTYDPMQFTASTAIGAFALTPDEARGTMTVVKGAANDQIQINTSFPQLPVYNDTLTAILKDSAFTVTKHTNPVWNTITINSTTTVNSDFNASGEFTRDKNIIVRFTVQTIQNGTTISRIGSFTAPKI